MIISTLFPFPSFPRLQSKHVAVISCCTKDALFNLYVYRTIIPFCSFRRAFTFFFLVAGISFHYTRKIKHNQLRISIASYAPSKTCALMETLSPSSWKYLNRSYEMSSPIKSTPAYLIIVCQYFQLCSVWWWLRATNETLKLHLF